MSLVSLYDEASLWMTPSGAEDGRLYSIKPVPEYGSEILTQPVDIDTDFNANSGGVIVDANTFTTAGGSSDGIISSSLIQAGKQYRLEIQGTTTSNGFTFGDGGTGSGNEYGTGFGVHYFTAVHQVLWFRQGTAGTTNITTFSIKEVSNIGDFTFSRGSNLAATRVDANGLVEKGRENLLLQSNQFDTTWIRTADTTITGGQSGYDGTNEAWLLTKDENQYRAIYQDVSVAGVWTLSVYAKSNTLDIITLRDNDSQGRVEFDLSDGSVRHIRTENIVAYDISSVGNDWYRCQVSFSGTTSRIQFYADFNDPTEAGSIYIQDAQLEQGLVATDYIETGASTAQAGVLEDEPRLDYSGGATCPSLLLEPSRTQLLQYSEFFNTYYTRSNSSLTDNAATSPEGLKNASKLIPDSGTGGNRSLGRPFAGLSGIHTFSTFAKAGEYDYVSLRMRNAGSAFVMFDLSDGSVHNIVDAGGQYVTNSAKVEDFGNGWYRCSASFDPGNSVAIGDLYPSLSAGITGDETNNFDGDGTSGIYIYGMQFEQGSYPTSYIPTYGTSQTRSRDLVNNQSLNPVLGNGNISVMYDFVYDVVGREGSGQIFILYSGNNSLGIKGTQPTDRRLQLFSYGDFSGTIGFNEDVPYQTRHKVVFRVTGEVVELFYNGVKQNNTIDASALGGVYNWSRIKLDPTNAILAGLNQLAVFSTALTDSECIALTKLD